MADPWVIEKKDYILPSGVLSSGLLPVFDARGFSGSNANLSSDRASLAWVRDQSQMKIGLGPVLSGLGVHRSSCHLAGRT